MTITVKKPRLLSSTTCCITHGAKITLTATVSSSNLGLKLVGNVDGKDEGGFLSLLSSCTLRTHTLEISTFRQHQYDTVCLLGNESGAIDKGLGANEENGI